jgi:hypothetical protein
VLLSRVAQDEYAYAHQMKMIDVATGREKWSLPIREKYTYRSVDMFSRDGALLFGSVSVYEHP